MRIKYIYHCGCGCCSAVEKFFELVDGFVIHEDYNEKISLKDFWEDFRTGNGPDASSKEDVAIDILNKLGEQIFG